MGKMLSLMYSDNTGEKIAGYAIYLGVCLGITYLSGKLMGKIVAKGVAKMLM